MIKWFRNAKYDVPKPQIPSVDTPSKPRKPKTPSPKKLKEPFKGPKSPQFYKRKLYVPKKFIMAADEAVMTDEEMQALLNPTTPEVVEEEEETEEIAEAPVAEVGQDPVSNALATIPNLTKITWDTPNANACEWCRSLNNRSWPTVAMFAADKANIRKHPSLDTLHLAHQSCSCVLKVDTATGERYKVDSVGVVEKI